MKEVPVNVTYNKERKSISDKEFVSDKKYILEYLGDKPKKINHVSFKPGKKEIVTGILAELTIKNGKGLVRLYDPKREQEQKDKAELLQLKKEVQEMKEKEKNNKEEKEVSKPKPKKGDSKPKKGDSKPKKGGSKPKKGDSKAKRVNRKGFDNQTKE